MGLTMICQALLGQDKTIQIKVPEGYDEITYDVSRVNRKNLDRWLTLSPVLSQNTDYLVPENTLQCPLDDNAYIGCGHEQVRLNPNNAERNQEKIRKRLEHLNTEKFPPEFEPIVSYFRAVQSFGLWRNQQEIDYAESRNFEKLERSYVPLGLNPKNSCPDVLRRIRTSTDAMSAWNLVTYDWANCMWAAFTKSVGVYPQQRWDAILKKNSIRENLVVQEN